jgi:F-type H+-transporting ATPase subunit a
MKFDFEEILAHHLLDHRFFPMLKLGPVTLSMSKHLIIMWIVAAVCTLVLTYAARSQSQAAVLLRAGVEAIVVFIRDELLHPIFHEATDTYLPYFLTLFFFIFTANLIGLVPMSSTITGNITVTASLAICTYFLTHFAGIKEQGLGSYLAHIAPGGLPIALVPLLFVIESFGLLAKCIALCIRLFANMIAGHIVSLAFISLIFIFGEMKWYIGFGVAPAAVGLALFIYTMDVLVCLLQAFIFTFLTALFVGGAVHPH